jgi:hypothetical protein
MEYTIPLSWLDQKRKLVFWPPTGESAAMAKKKQPQHDWWQFALLKIKMRSCT